MSQGNDLYQEVILDHSKKPRNFKKLEGASHTAEGFNPLCGDRLTLYLKVENDRIKEISFEGSGCAISKASASMMTQFLKDKNREEAENIFGLFHKMVTGENIEEAKSGLGKLAAFAGVSDYPVRVKCASLAWHTLKAALSNRQEPISTE